MPIYEYECKGCGSQFEFLKLPSTSEQPSCPNCEGSDLERVLSKFAVSSQSTRDANWNSARQKGRKVGLEKKREEEKYRHKILNDTDR